MFSLLIHTECALVLLCALTLPNFFILDGYSYRYYIYLVFGGMPGINGSRDCNGFFDCFYMQCVSNSSHFHFTDDGCGLSERDFLDRFPSHTDITQLIYMSKIACITYSCITLLMALVYMGLRRVKGIRGRTVIVVISTIIILSEILVRMMLVSLVLYIREIDVYLPNFLSDYNTIATEKTIALGMVITVLVTVMSFLSSFISVDPGMSVFTPLTWGRDRVASNNTDTE